MTLFVLPKAAPSSAGENYAGAKLYLFETGTTTPAPSYQNPTLITPHAHPVVADSPGGVFPAVWLDPSISYRVQIKTSAGVLLPGYDIDPYPGPAGIADEYVAVVGGSANAITLTPTVPIPAYAAGQRFRFIVASANTAAVTVAVSGLAAIAATKNGATALIAGDMPAGALVTIVHDGTQFQVESVIDADFGTYTGTLTGCTTSPTVTVKYARVGKMVTLHVPGVSATSNATGCSLTGAPASLRPASQPTGRGVISEFYNNTVLEYGAMSCELTIAGALEFRRAGSLTGFTNAGTKGPSDFMFTYLLNTA